MQVRVSEPGAKEVREAFARHGLVDGQDFTLDFQGPGTGEDLKRYRDRLVRSRPEVIVVVAGPFLDALAAKTHDIPIVFYNSASDPEQDGLVKSLRRPGGNITGTDLGWADMRTKQWQLLKEFVPAMKRGGVLNVPGGVDEIIAAGREREVYIHPAQRLVYEAQRRAARELGIQIRAVPVKEDAPEADVVDAIGKAKVETMLVNITPTPAIVSALVKSRIPSCGAFAGWARQGLLSAVSFDFTEGEGHAVGIVAQILRGVSPAVIPIYRATRWGVAINRSTARAIGIDIPQSVRMQANEVFD